MAMTDNENKIVYSRLGNIFRVAGTVEMSGNNLTINKQNLNFLYENVQKTFADFGDIKNAKEWVGMRPFRPNSIPLIGDINKFSNQFQFAITKLPYFQFNRETVTHLQI